MTRRRAPTQVIGWREWLAMPDLGVSAIKAKVDTGARTSSLHAFDLRQERVGGEPGIRFALHPIQRDDTAALEAAAPLIDQRRVRPSTGRSQLRPVIATSVTLGGTTWVIEVTLVRRDMMGFRMLLGRQALRRRFLVDSGRSFLAGPPIVAGKLEV